MERDTFTREEIEEKVEKLLEKGKYTKEQLGYITDYHLDEKVLTEKNKERLDRLYLEKIFEEKEKIKDKIGNIENIKTLVSFISFSLNSEADILQELPIEKSLRVFDNIENLYILHTDETKEHYKKIVKIIKKKYKKLKITEMQVEVNNLNDIYTPLKEKIMTGEIKSENTVFDVTLGLKMTGIALYKLASERSIISINWKELQLPRFIKEKDEYREDSNRLNRIQLTTVLDVMQEPIIENLKNRILINSALERGEYLLAAGYYEKIGMEDFGFFFKELDRVFSFEMMFLAEPEIFFERVGEFLKNILKYKFFEKSTIKKLKEFVVLLLAIYIDEKGEQPAWIKNNNLKITFEEIESKMEILAKEEGSYTMEIFCYLILKFFYKKINREFLRNSGLDSIKEEMDGVLEDGEKPKELKKAKSIEEVKDILFGEDLCFIEDELIVLDVERNFKEKVNSQITFESNILRIEKYGVEINFSPYEKLVKNLNNKSGKPLLYLLTNKEEDKYIDRDSFFVMMIGEKDYDLEDVKRKFVKISKEDLKGKDQLYRKEKVDTKKIIVEFNEIVREKLCKYGHEPKDFFILSRGTKEEKALKINEEFYKIV